MRGNSTCSALLLSWRPHEMATELVVNPTAPGPESIDVGRDIMAELVAERDCLEAAFVHSKRLICEGALYLDCNNLNCSLLL